MPGQTLPTVGERLPDFPGAEFSRHRGRRNLVVLLSPPEALLGKLAARADDLSYEEAQVLVLSPEPRESSFPVLMDSGLEVHSALGGLNAQGRPTPVVLVADRYGEIYAAFGGAHGTPLPDVPAILGWIEFINSQCPE
jgi:hypothetical protein